MFKDLSNTRSCKRGIQELAHNLGLAAEVHTQKDSAFVDFIITLEMNRQRFNSYCHKEGNNLVMSDQARLNQIQAEVKMVNDFWMAMIGEMKKVRNRAEWYFLSTEITTLYPIKRYEIAELQPPGMKRSLNERCLRIHHL
jgi:hypothetical protein